ncbi:MAG: bifunctional DNA primase/polymerase [Chloroflexi bacterium]|nr:bifunctional DNA primase/polymerase [Chloroflexota bacterium]
MHYDRTTDLAQQVSANSNSPRPHRDAALDYAAHGYHVFPTRPDKRPHIKRWQAVATTDPAQIDRWWRRWPTAGIGIAHDLSGTIAIDVDAKPEDGRDGWATLRRLQDQHTLPATLTMVTPSGGAQYIYARPAELAGQRGNRPNAFGPGVDLIAGYSVVPSPADPGRQWTDDPAQLPAWLPSWAAEPLRPKPRPIVVAPAPNGETQDGDGRRYLAYAAQRVSIAQRGRRNHALNRWVFALAGAHAAGWAPDRSVTEAVMIQAAMAAGLTDLEALTTFESAWAAGLAQPMPRVERSPKPKPTDRTTQAGAWVANVLAAYPGKPALARLAFGLARWYIMHGNGFDAPLRPLVEDFGISLGSASDWLGQLDRDGWLTYDNGIHHRKAAWAGEDYAGNATMLAVEDPENGHVAPIGTVTLNLRSELNNQENPSGSARAYRRWVTVGCSVLTMASDDGWLPGSDLWRHTPASAWLAALAIHCGAADTLGGLADVLPVSARTVRRMVAVDAAGERSIFALDGDRVGLALDLTDLEATEAAYTMRRRVMLDRAIEALDRRRERRAADRVAVAGLAAIHGRQIDPLALAALAWRAAHNVMGLLVPQTREQVRREHERQRIRYHRWLAELDRRQTADARLAIGVELLAAD